MSTAAADTATFDVQEFIDHRPVGAQHYLLLALCTFIMFLDGFDIFMLGKMAPAIADYYGEKPEALTQIFFLQQMGLTAGAFLISPLSDRFGRKTVLTWSTFAFGILTLVTVWAGSLTQVAILRGLSGIFLAAVIPNVTALLTEFAPAKRRAAFVAVAFGGFTIGGAAGAFVVIGLLERYGWQSGFWIGGLVPLAMVPIMLLFMRESLLFRVRRDPADPAIGAALRSLDGSLSFAPGTRFAAGAARPSQGRGDLLQVFKEGRAPLTGLLWAIYFVALGVIALLASWMATFFNKLGGISLQDFATVSLIGFLGSFAGTMTVGFIMDRFRPVRVLILLFVLDAIALACLPFFTFGSAASLAVFIIWGYCQTGGQAGLNALCAQAYPTAMRSTGVGWAFGMGRFGGVFAPLLGGVALAIDLNLTQVLLGVAVLPLFVAALLIAFERVIARRPLGL